MRRLLGLFMLLLLGQVLYAQGTKNSAKQSQSSSSANATREIEVNGVKFKMIYVEGDKFWMGYDGYGSEFDQRPEHQVRLSDYYIGETEVTQELWEAVMGSNPSSYDYRSPHNPVINVSWDDCWRFIHKLNQLTGLDFRLPTEAEWEYAARGGNKSKGYTFSGSDDIDKVAWYGGNSDGKVHEVKKLKPNELGIYDISGNVAEWCYDSYLASFYKKSNTVNPMRSSSSAYRRVFRGGSWAQYPKSCSVFYRCNDWQSNCYTFLGFRLVIGDGIYHSY